MTKRRLSVAILSALLLIGVVGTAERAVGQFFICSAGPFDGAPCQSDDDCASTQGGACVVIQGVCDGGGTDGFPCDCPNGTCAASPVCSGDVSLGTCQGGVFNTDCCDVGFNCEDAAPCLPSQKICCSGTDKGFSCLNNGQCTGPGGGSCISTGRFCSGGDFDSYTCCDDADCGAGGECITAPFVVPTLSPTVPQQAFTPTRTATTLQPSPTGTQRTATPTSAANTPTRTSTTLVVVNTPTAPSDGPSIIDYSATADGACALTPRVQANPLWWSLMALAMFAAGRRKSK